MATDDENQGITAYHGSPHEFEQFDLSKIGTGEGAQAYGHGLYFAEAEPTAKEYRDKLTSGTYKTSEGNIFDPSDLEHLNLRTSARRGIDEALLKANELISSQPQNAEMIQRDIEKLTKAQEKSATPHAGHMYEVSINAHPDHFLDWDKPFTDQSPYVKNILKTSGLMKEYNDNLSDFSTPMQTRNKMKRGENIHAYVEHKMGKDSEKASQYLQDLGIKGIKYLDAGSRDKRRGTRNYVVFDDKLVNVKRKYARGGMIDGYAHGGSVKDRPHFGFGGEGEGPMAGSTGSAAGNSYGGGSNTSGGPGSAPGSLGGGGGNQGSSFGGGGGGNSGNFLGGGGGNSGGGGGGGGAGGGYNGLNLGVPSGMGAFGRPVGGVSSGLGFDANSGAEAGEMSPVTGGFKNMALGSNIGGEMLGQALQGGSYQSPSAVGSGMSNFDIHGAAPQAGFGDRPSMVAGSDIGPGMTISGSLGAAQVQGMREDKWSNENDPTGISQGIALGQRLATPTNAAREANALPNTGMYGQPQFGTTTFGTGIPAQGFPSQESGTQDPSQAAYAEQMAKTAREQYLQANFPESPRLGDLATPAPARAPAVPDRAGSMGSMPTTYSQPTPPHTPTPISGYPQDVQKAIIPNMPDSAFRTGMTIDPTGTQTQKALENMNVASDAVTMLNSPTLAGSLVRMFAPTPTEATPQQQASINRMYQGSFDTGVPSDFGTLGGLESRYGSPTSQPAHPSTPTPSTAYGGMNSQDSANAGLGSFAGSLGNQGPVAQSPQSSNQVNSIRSNFNQAFAQARANGADTFEWTNPLTGRTSLYTTQLARKDGGRVPSLNNPDDWLAHIKIDTPKGKKREHHGSKPLPVDYGHIAGTKGADNMDVDAFVGPNKNSKKAFVINQVHPVTGKFDEHKVMLGFNSLPEAVNAYQKSYPAGLADKMLGPTATVSARDAIAWSKSGKIDGQVDKDAIVKRANMLLSKKS